MKYNFKRKSKYRKIVLLSLMLMVLGAIGFIAFFSFDADIETGNIRESIGIKSDLLSLQYDGDISVEINENRPVFSDEELETAQKGFETYSDLDEIGRCGTAEASICTETMPAEGEKRTGMGSVYPSGWQAINFWSRCHLIGWQLSAENANERNLITGTSRLNLSGMLPYENKVAEYIHEHPGNHVLYRVEPIYDGDDPVASGVSMQAESVEDNGEGLAFNVYVFNFQPGYIINYSKGTVVDDPDHQTIITIEDKVEEYTGEPITIDDAVVEGSTGDVRYIYYTDEEAKIKTTENDGAFSNGAAPTKPGIYRVRAVVAGDNWYPTAASNIAMLEIE